MSEMQYSRRRNQIIAERNAAKARLVDRSILSRSQLESMIMGALQSNLNTQVALGHIDKAYAAAMAQEAWFELVMRGQQLGLFD